MDCLYGRLDGEEAYIRRLWTLTASNLAPPEAVVSLELVCYDRPLVPYRWLTSGRPTVYRLRTSRLPQGVSIGLWTSNTAE
jgi:hypothetical protein